MQKENKSFHDKFAELSSWAEKNTCGDKSDDTNKEYVQGQVASRYERHATWQKNFFVQATIKRFSTNVVLCRPTPIKTNPTSETNRRQQGEFFRILHETFGYDARMADVCFA
jgi:hypothetical protein